MHPFYLFFVMIAGLLFLPTTIVLCVGMLPTLVAAFIDQGRKKTLAFTVGAMNLAGCSPFLFELWKTGHDFSKGLEIVLDPKAIIVMYAAAAIGYLINWAMVGIISRILYQKAEARIESIKKQQKKLVERWGKKVTGQLVLDEEGFPVQDKEEQT